jgi:hypothetical protein
MSIVYKSRKPKIIVNPNQFLAIVDSIKLFPIRYHDVFKEVRIAADSWFETTKEDKAVRNNLAGLLHQGLKMYGAGCQGAPEVADEDSISESLKSVGCRQLLIAVKNQGRELFFNPNSNFDTESIFAGDLFKAISFVREHFYKTSVQSITYYMKAIMLLTGAIPAFDGNVRDGLTSIGVLDMKTQVNTPHKLDSSEMRKIVGILRVFRDAWHINGEIFLKAIDQANPSGASLIKSSPARQFDILLFKKCEALGAEHFTRLWSQRHGNFDARLRTKRTNQFCVES